jgi:pullulanase
MIRLCLIGALIWLGVGAIVQCSSSGAAGIPADHLRIYYLRQDQNYQGWGLHLWGEWYTGPAVTWTGPMAFSGQDHYGCYWDVPYSQGNLYFIIHNGDRKDPDSDQSFPVREGIREIYIVSGMNTIYRDLNQALDAIAANRIIRAEITGPREFLIKTRFAVDPAVIRISDGQNDLSIVACDGASAPLYRVTVGEAVDFSQQYTVKIAEGSKETEVAPDLLERFFLYRETLGNSYTPAATTFKLWAPLATEVKLLLFGQGDDLEPAASLQMDKQNEGVWTVAVPGDLSGKFYQFAVANFGKTRRILDPYARSMAAFDSGGSDPVGKGAVVDLDRTHPVGWEVDRPIKVENQEDVIIYEMSVRDFTIAANSGVEPRLRGTYQGFIQKIPHLQELGITHVQLLPVQNWYYGNERNREYEATHDSPANYNWGYDPHNYNTPEGWYATDPENPYTRIKELKQLICALHQAGIGVILDVVYNHTARTEILEDIVPNYYYRHYTDGSFTTGSGCGNDTASERAMWRKFMVESATYWMKEYHVDGFRFDLAGLHDETTLKEVAAVCRSLNPSVTLHCEGWDMGTLPLKERYTKGGEEDGESRGSCLEMEHGISMFNDGFRDGILQPSYVDLTGGAFVQGQRDDAFKIRAGVIGGLRNYVTIFPIETAKYHRFCDDPEETVNYTTCHDGLTLWDKICVTLPRADEAERIRTNKLAAAIILTSQGKAFIQGGEEMLRTKPDPNNPNGLGVSENTHDQGDYCNQIDWSRRGTYRDVFEYYKGLIRLRKAHRLFRMTTEEEVCKGLTFLAGGIDFLVAFELESDFAADPWKKIIVIYNANRSTQRVPLSQVNSEWKVAVDGVRAGTEPLAETEVEVSEGYAAVPPVAATVLFLERGVKP